MLFYSIVILATSAAQLVSGHASPSTPFSNHPEEIARRQLETNERHVMARNCAPQVAEYQRLRKERRDLQRRGLAFDDSAMDLNKRQTTTSSALSPHYSTIQNTCVGAPEVTEGPYYLRNDLVRTDLREGQSGTPLYLDVGVLDITTCTPATNAFVEIWACSAQGVYAGFGGASSGSGGPGGGGGGGGSSSKTNTNNFLRGGYAANANGVAELLTIYPGFYTGRTVHIHTMIHQNIQTFSNGTFGSATGSLRHIGQIFFDEALNTQVLAQTAYQNSGQTRTLNSADSIFKQENSGGNSAYASVTRLGSSLSDGLLAYITIGINSKATQKITTTNYYGPVKRSEDDDDD